MSQVTASNAVIATMLCATSSDSAVDILPGQGAGVGVITKTAGNGTGGDSARADGKPLHHKAQRTYSPQDIADAVKSGIIPNDLVAAAFAAFCTANGLSQNQSSFSKFAADESPKLQSAGLSASEAQTTLDQGAEFALGGVKARSFSIGNAQA